jgi:hypothetical protein
MSHIRHVMRQRLAPASSPCTDCPVIRQGIVLSCVLCWKVCTLWRSSPIPAKEIVGGKAQALPAGVVSTVCQQRDSPQYCLNISAHHPATLGMGCEVWTLCRYASPAPEMQCWSCKHQVVWWGLPHQPKDRAGALKGSWAVAPHARFTALCVLAAKLGCVWGVNLWAHVPRATPLLRLSAPC